DERSARLASIQPAALPSGGVRPAHDAVRGALRARPLRARAWNAVAEAGGRARGAPRAGVAQRPPLAAAALANRPLRARQHHADRREKSRIQPAIPAVVGWGDQAPLDLHSR